MSAPPYYGTPAHTPEAGTVDDVPREALRVVLALAAREAGNRNPDHRPGCMFSRAIQQVRAAYDGKGEA